MYIWIKRMCNVYLAFSNSKAYQCATSTRRIYTQKFYCISFPQRCHHLPSMSQGILGYLFLYSEDSCLSLLNISNYMYSFWPLYNQHSSMCCPHRKNGKNLLTKWNMDFPECASEMNLCFVPLLTSQQGTIIVGPLTAKGRYSSLAYHTVTKTLLWGSLLLLLNTRTSQSWVGHLPLIHCCLF